MFLKNSTLKTDLQYWDPPSSSLLPAAAKFFRVLRYLCPKKPIGLGYYYDPYPKPKQMRTKIRFFFPKKMPTFTLKNKKLLFLFLIQIEKYLSWSWWTAERRWDSVEGSEAEAEAEAEGGGGTKIEQVPTGSFQTSIMLFLVSPLITVSRTNNTLLNGLTGKNGLLL